MVSEREAARIHEVVAGPEPGRLTWWRLWIAGDLRVFSGLEWDAQAERYGMGLRASVRGEGGFSDGSARGKGVELEVLVDGIPVERFTGKVDSAVEVLDGRGRATGAWEVRAASRGDSLENKELKERVSWDQAPPHLLVADAIGRSGYTGRVVVEQVEEPAITAKESAAFPASASPADELAAVEAEVPAYEMWDVPGDGHEAFLRTPPEEIEEPDFVFDAARLEGFRPEPVEARVAWVAVRRQKEPPDPLADPWEELARAPVAGSTADEDTVEWVDSSDRSAGAVGRAFQTAGDRAAEISGRQRVSFTGPEHPLLRRGSRVWVRQGGADGAGPFLKTWAVYLDTLTGSLPRKKTAYAGDCAVVEVVREPGREAPMPAATPGVVDVAPSGRAAVLAGDDATIEELGDRTIEEMSP